MRKYIKNTLLGIFIISSVIIFHELGHLLVGIWLNQSPESFSIGFGPKLISYIYYDISWEIRAIPLGGFVSFPENSNYLSFDFFWTILAGPFMNFILAFILFYIFFSRINSKIKVYKLPHHNNIVIVDLSYFGLGVCEYDFENKTRKKNINIENDYSIRPISINPLKYAIFALLFNSWLADIIINSFKSDYKIKSGIIGPIGIIKQGISEFNHHYLSFILYMGGLSFGLGILNLIPVPIFDGGKIFMIMFHHLGLLFFIDLIISFFFISIIRNRINVWINSPK